MTMKRLISNKLDFPTQGGATLLISLIMLVMITLMAVSSFNIGDSNLKIVANAQDKQRAEFIAEQVLNDRLNTIATGKSSNPCDLSVLKAADGTTTETVDGVAVELSRTLTRTQCVANSSVLNPWTTASDDFNAAAMTAEKQCEDNSDSEACATATDEMEAKLKIKSKATARAIECTRKVNSAGVLILDHSGASTSSASGNSYCVDVIMELRADATDSKTGARSTVMRGISLHCSDHDVPTC